MLINGFVLFCFIYLLLDEIEPKKEEWSSSCITTSLDTNDNYLL